MVVVIPINDFSTPVCFERLESRLDQRTWELISDGVILCNPFRVCRMTHRWLWVKIKAVWSKFRSIFTRHLAYKRQQGWLVPLAPENSNRAFSEINLESFQKIDKLNFGHSKLLMTRFPNNVTTPRCYCFCVFIFSWPQSLSIILFSRNHETQVTSPWFHLPQPDWTTVNSLSAFT